MRRVLIAAILGTGSLAAASAAQADVALALRGSTLGIGAELAIGMTEKLNLRLGYAMFDYGIEIEDTDVTYDGDLELRNPSALLDWHAFGGGFHATLGVVGASTKIVGTGVPSAGNSYVINNNIYSAAQIGRLDATVEASNSVAPYIGIGWGNPVDEAERWTFLFDLGVVYYGTEPDVVVNATCGPTLPALLCTRLQADVAAERAELVEDVDTLSWYPVVSAGFSFRF